MKTEVSLIKNYVKVDEVLFVQKNYRVIKMIKIV